MANNLTIVVPAFNEEQSIYQVVKELKENFSECELIVVDDGSEDKTGELAKNAGAKVISHPKNYGYGASLKTGIQGSSGDYVITFDADGQHSVEDLKKLLEDYDDYDAVVGIRDSRSHTPLPRRPGKFILRVFFNFLTGEKIEDFNCGLRIFKKATIIRYLHMLCDEFSFSTSSLITMLNMRKRIKYVPIKVKKRIGKSTVHQLRHGIYVLMLILRLTVLFNPLKVFLLGAGFFFMLGIISLCFDCYYVGSFNVSTTTSLMFVSALIVFMFALLCDQVAAIRRQMNE
jgi:glycosyltransferase involved in cell wall biosynthesis